MNDVPIPVSKTVLTEALNLAEDILKNIELNEISLNNIALKVARLTRLLNDFDYQKIIEYEIEGYPTNIDSNSYETIWKFGIKSNRIYTECNKDGTTKPVMYFTSIAVLENEINSFQFAISAAQDPDVSISSANPTQTIFNPMGNVTERNFIRYNLTLNTSRLAERRSFLYKYVLDKYNQLKYSNITDDVFSRIRYNVDSIIGDYIPESVKQFTPVYENLKSDNTEDWSNAVHSCRRILEALADKLYPTTEDKVIKCEGKDKIIKLGKDNYINRLIQFIEENSNSNRYKDIVGSHLKYIGERLDSIFSAAQKGSHDNITSKEEADRYVVYTYLIVGDILSLVQEVDSTENGTEYEVN